MLEKTLSEDKLYFETQSFPEVIQECRNTFIFDYGMGKFLQKEEVNTWIMDLAREVVVEL